MPSSLNGTGITFSDATTQSTARTASNTVTSVNGQVGAASVGTVTSVATGNGLQGGTITSTGTLSIACPTFGSIGSYAGARSTGNVTAGSNYSGMLACNFGSGGSGTLAGTWKWMGASMSNTCGFTYDSIACRVA